MKFNMSQKFTSKGFNVDDLGTILEKRQKAFKRLWEARLSGQMPEIPTLETVMRETNRFFQRHF